MDVANRLFRLPLLAASAILGIGVVYILISYIRVLRLRSTLPPGPFPLPLLGNYFDVPRLKPWVKFEQLAKKHNNPLITIWVGTTPYIICNDSWTAAELLEKRSSVYSSRPDYPFLSYTLSGEGTMPQILLPYGDKWRLHRKFTHAVTGQHVVPSYREIQAAESAILTTDVLDDPDAASGAIERYACSVMSIITWSRRVADLNDFVAQSTLAMQSAVDWMIPCYNLIDVIPAITKLPSWLLFVPNMIRKGQQQTLRGFYRVCEEGVAAPGENFAKKLFRSREQEGLQDHDIAVISMLLLLGGLDTTTCSTLTFMLAMCAFPDVQHKAQQELDNVVGRDRSPGWDDLPNLPYINALVSEVYRWRPVANLGGMAHCPTQDDEYKGYKFPKGTAIYGNNWAIHHNATDYPSPDDFRPERFIEGDPLRRPFPVKKGHFAFGFGRRICSGMPLAEQGLSSSIARLLWAFDIRPGLDESGNEVTPDIFAYTNAENTRPDPFKVRFIPRTPEIEKIIREEADVARDKLRMYDRESKNSRSPFVGDCTKDAFKWVEERHGEPYGWAKRCISHFKEIADGGDRGFQVTNLFVCPNCNRT